MTNDQMREAFEAHCKRNGVPPDLMDDEYEVWQAAYAAGMERAAGICDLNSEQWDTAANGTAAYAAGRCADTIRAEIKGAGHEG